MNTCRVCGGSGQILQNACGIDMPGTCTECGGTGTIVGQLRPVMVCKWEPNADQEGMRVPGYHHKELYTALFHQFGTESNELDLGAEHYQVAIVEKEDGTVETVEASLIRFEDK